MRSKRERRKPQRFDNENLEERKEITKMTNNASTKRASMLPAKRVRTKPQRLEDEVPDPPPKKKTKKQQEVNANAKINSKSKTKVPIEIPVKNEIRTFQASGTMNVRKTKQGNSYVVKSKIKTIVDISDTEVYVQTATATQIQNASKKQYRPTKAEKSQLIQIPSHLNRAKIYLNATKAISKKEARALPSHGARPWFCHVSLADEQGACASSSNYNDDVYEVKKNIKKGKMSSSPLFVWNKYHLELAALPNILNNIDEIDTNHGLLKSVQEEFNAMEMEEGYLTDDEDYINQLMEREVTVLSTVASNDSNYVIPSIDRKWISPDLVTFRSRNAAVQHSLMLLDRDKLIDRVMHGIGSRGALLRPVKPTRKLALEAGYCRFLRDGLWVVGQEEGWIEERVLYLKQRDEVVKNDNQPNNNIDDDHDRDEVSEEIKNTSQISSNGHNVAEGSNQQNDSENDQHNLNSNCQSGENSKDVGEELSKTQQTQCDSGDNDPGVPNVNQIIGIDNCKDTKVSDDRKEHSVESGGTDETKEVGGTKLVIPSLEQANESTTDVTKKEIIKAKSIKMGTQHGFVPSTHFRLTSKQIDMCYNAIMDHYEKVMYTVKAKALYSELADGFDVFRERGRGRFDMTLEAFDKPEFSFLTDLTKAAWMPIVKKILGDDAALVHKGAFLSTPGAETQIYHQDGVHLNKKYQKPCHAINVFIPLVDLHEKNGPTEFCIGTHYLGFEDYNKDLIDSPLAPAGCPVIFDYRLGHRGLGNNSRETRPIVYLTYTRVSKEFRDAVNFSSKRYRKLGELIEKPMSRKERALKRTREA